MATIIPTINSCTGKMTAGEKRLSRILEGGLSDETLCWYDIPTGDKHSHPDFIILAPDSGILFIEVKDWFASRIKTVNKSELLYEAQDGAQFHANPVEQVREYANGTINQLKNDMQLVQQEGKYKGNFCAPYGYGVYLSNITRKQYDTLFPDDAAKNVLPADKVICKDELTEFMSEVQITARLKRLLPHTFAFEITVEKINRIRWHLYPEIRINAPVKDAEETPDTGYYLSTPTIIKIMDAQQELLARSLGEGHRVIHGVAGSGKTLILLYRCLHLAKNAAADKPILVICYNITLARKLAVLINNLNVHENIQVTNFHAWCYQQVNTHYKAAKKSFDNIAELEDALTKGFSRGAIPSGQYRAVLIDEGHDFKAEWLSVLSKMVTEQTSSLLFMYDDAQSIYQERNSLDFSLASVGIQAQGRTTILKLNYRNTRQILHFASAIAFKYLNDRCNENRHYDKPDAAGDCGPYPLVKKFQRPEDEISHVAQWLLKEHDQGVDWHDMAILMPSTRYLPPCITKTLEENGIPFRVIYSSADKKRYSPDESILYIFPLPSSKGLEFHSVAVMDCCNTSNKSEDLSDDIKKLYVGFTRATRHLLVTLHRENALSEHLISTYEAIVAQNSLT